MTLQPSIPAGFMPRLAALYVAIFVLGGIQMPFFPLWLKANGLDAQAIGLLLSIPMLVRVIVVPLVTRQADLRDGLRPLLVVCACTSVMGYASLGIAQGPVSILAFFAVASAAYTPVMPLTDAYALRGLPPLGRAYGTVRLWGSGAFIVGGFLAGYAADLLPARDLIWLITAGYAGVALAALALAPLSPLREAGHENGKRKGLLRDPVYLVVLAAASLIQASHAVFYSFSVVAWSAKGLDGVAIAALWALGVVAEIALFAVSGRLPSWITPIRLLLIGATGATLRWAGMALDPPAAVLPWLQLLHALSFAATHLGTLGFIARHTPPAQGATAQGYLAIAVGLAMAVATGISGLLFAAFGSGAYAAMALSAIAGGACALIAKRLSRREAMA
ncbi:MAG TPA: MFS transporter [Pseudolabrys sp.]|nr:MFS transporter [Pseudolabrys sp.]